MLSLVGAANDSKNISRGVGGVAGDKKTWISIHAWISNIEVIVHTCSVSNSPHFLLNLWY